MDTHHPGELADQAAWDQILSSEQEQVLDFVKNRKNVFFTGGAGTGKSLVLRRIKLWLQHTLPSEEFAIAAPTGIAAINVGGCTLHSLVGAGVPKVYGDFKKMWATRASWERMQILVIDEIGMAAASFLDAISSEIATMRGESDKAFGGIQLVFCGDFGQLGPIEDEQASSGQQAAGEARPFVNTGLAFQARMWRAACFEVVTR